MFPTLKIWVQYADFRLLHVPHGYIHDYDHHLSSKYLVVLLWPSGVRGYQQVMVRCLVYEKCSSVHLLHRILYLSASNHPNYAGLFRNALENTKDVSITSNETKFSVYESLLIRELFDQHASLS